MRASPVVLGGGGGGSSYETLEEFSLGEGADHVYAFKTSATKYDDSAGSNSLQAVTGKPQPSWYAVDDAAILYPVDGAEGTLIFNSNDGTQQQTSSGMRMDRSTDLTFAVVFQLTNTTDFAGSILGVTGADFAQGGNQYIPFEVWSFNYKLTLTTPGTYYNIANIGTAAGSIGANMTVGLVARYIAAEDKVSWRLTYPGYTYAGDYQPSDTRQVRREDGNFVVYPYDSALNVRPKSAAAGSTSQVVFGASPTDNATRDMRLWHVGIWLNEALTDEQADAFFALAGL
jgi:hypothetical protein